jgi:hypothetical protein
MPQNTFLTNPAFQQHGDNDEPIYRPSHATIYSPGREKNCPQLTAKLDAEGKLFRIFKLGTDNQPNESLTQIF